MKIAYNDSGISLRCKYPSCTRTRFKKRFYAFPYLIWRTIFVPTLSVLNFLSRLGRKFNWKRNHLVVKWSFLPNPEHISFFPHKETIL